MLELLVVVALIALASGLSVVALRDASAQRLEQEAVRLSALLEAARLEARTSAWPLIWRPVVEPTGSGQSSDPGALKGRFAFEVRGRTALSPTSSDSGKPTLLPDLPRSWLHAGTSAEVVGATMVILGPDPILRPQAIRLRLGQQQLVVSTDGLGPFRIDETARSP